MVAHAFQSRLRSALTGIAFFVPMLPWVAAAQQTGSAVDPSTAKLPEIHVIATTPVAPPARPTPARRVSGGAAPARTAGAPAAPAAAEAPAAKPIPGAVEQDKIPSNVQTAGAPDFSYTVTPDLLQSMVRA